MNQSRLITNHHAAPLRMPILLDVEFTFAEGIPELNRLITRTGDDLPVISTEADGQNIRGVSDKFPGCLAGVQVPKTEGVIPRSGESELSVGGDDNVGNEVVVSVENAFWVTKRVFIPGQLPDDDSFVCRDKGQIMSPFLVLLDSICVPREAVRIISGFSEEVAIAVTHPAWPGSEPR